ncbi:MAG: hypothetical protein COX81_03590, partial [Candidatus Magasanikbacteria bacterium CG_4_10_14_0_2_um_filter_37_12]
EYAGPSDEERNKSLASIDQAKATVAQYQASLVKAEAIASADISNAEKALDTAKNNLQLVVDGEDSQLVNDAYGDLVNVIKSVFTNIVNALNESDNILGVDNSFANDDFEDYLGLLDSSSSAFPSAKISYQNARVAKKNLESSVISLSASDEHNVIDSVSTEVNKVVVFTQKSLFNVQSLLNVTIPAGNFTQSQFDVLKTSVSTAQTNLNTSATNLTNAIQSVATARNSLSSYQIAYDKAVADLENTKKKSMADIDIAKAQVASQEANLKQAQATYDLLISDPRDVDVASLRAEVSRQAANVQALRDNFQKTKLIALADGTLAKLDIDVGENVSANQEVMTLTSSKFNVEVDISESDIAKVAIGDRVDVTLDAFGDDVHFDGAVVSIEPGKTEISGVVYYKTKVLMDDYPDRPVKSGMTANVNINTDRQDGVLVLPRRAVIFKDAKKIVRVLTNKEKVEFEEREVTTGLEGNDGLVEILSGLQKGEEVITFLKEE